MLNEGVVTACKEFLVYLKFEFAILNMIGVDEYKDIWGTSLINNNFYKGSSKKVSLFKLLIRRRILESEIGVDFLAILLLYFNSLFPIKTLKKNFDKVLSFITDEKSWELFYSVLIKFGKSNEFACIKTPSNYDLDMVVNELILTEKDILYVLNNSSSLKESNGEGIYRLVTLLNKKQYYENMLGFGSLATLYLNSIGRTAHLI